MSAMSNLHADVLQLVAHAETRSCGYRWSTVEDDLNPGSTIQMLTGCNYPMFTLPVRLVEYRLEFDQFTLCPLHRTLEGVITKAGDSVRVRTADGEDAEICTVSDALGVFA
jgi:hypothetical protein